MPTVAIDENTHKEAKKLSETYDLNLGELMHDCIMYFKKTGMNPHEADTESPYKAVKELDKHIGQIVGVLQTHEKKKLNPLLEQLIITSQQLDDTIKILPTTEHFNNVVTGVNKYVVDLKNNHAEQLALVKSEQQQINQNNQIELKSLTAAVKTLTGVINSLVVGQQEINKTIEDKLRKNLLG